MPKPPENTREFQALVETVAALRGPEGCPWDKEQTHKTLTQYAIEEAHELAEAIDGGDTKDITEELGDLLLQVVLHSEIGRQDGTFTIEDVIQSINSKMIHRHPHVFSDVKVSSIAEVWDNWTQLKEKEKAPQENPFSSIPLNLPALIRAAKIGVKTRKYNFDWNHVSQVVAKVDEELAELKEVLAEINSASEKTQATPADTLKQNLELKKNAEHELGDLLFSISQLARHLELDAEQCLRQCNTRFIHRFQGMQFIAEKNNQKLTDLTQTELEKLYQQAKSEE